MKSVIDSFNGLMNADTKLLYLIFIIFSIPQIVQITFGVNILISLKILQSIQIIVFVMIIYRLLVHLSRRKKIKRKLKSLDVNERSLLSRFVNENRKSLLLDANSEIVNELCLYEILVEGKPHNIDGSKSFYKLDDWVENYIRKNQRLVKVYIDEVYPWL